MQRPLAVLSAATALLLGAPPPPAAAATAAPCADPRDSTETKAHSSVDEGEIRWTSSTKYRTEWAHAVKVWQFSGAKIKILADSASTVNDLDVSDFSSKTDKKAGHWAQNTGTAATDRITLNVTLLAGYGVEMRRNVLVHELGHALGFCHKSDGGKTAVQSVMWANASAHEAPTEVDKANYRKLWGS